MDLEIFDKMEKEDLRKYIEFLLWHYRVIDAFWYINITEHFDEPTADRLNEKVWGRAGAMAAKDLHKRFKIVEQGLGGFVKALFPGVSLSAMKLHKHPMKLLLRFPHARPRRPESNGA